MRFLPFVFITTLVCVTNMHASEAPAATNLIDTEGSVTNIIEAWLQSCNISSVNLPKKLHREYLQAIADATKKIDQFLKKFTMISVSVDVEIEKHLQSYDLSSDSIPSSLQSEFDNKRRTIIKKVKQLKQSPISRKSISQIVHSQIDYDLIKRLKSPPSSGSWLEALGGAITAIADAIGGGPEKPEPDVSPNAGTPASNTLYVYYSSYCNSCGYPFITGERVGVSSCGHIFHENCYHSCCDHSKTCPVCNTHGVYLAKIYDSIEYVPGYYEPTPAYNPEITSPDPYATDVPDFEDIDFP